MIIAERTSGPLSRRADKHVPMLDDPPIGHLQALILKKLDYLGSEAIGYNALEELSLETGVWLDASQIYASIRKLAEKELIKQTGTRRQQAGPPLKVYEVTAPGRAALKATSAHHRAVADYLDDNSKRKAART